jgi:hypothetical protein
MRLAYSWMSTATEWPTVSLLPGSNMAKALLSSWRTGRHDKADILDCTLQTYNLQDHRFGTNSGQLFN